MALSIRDLDNDTRGWIMCIVSGIGASNPQVFFSRLPVPLLTFVY